MRSYIVQFRYLQPLSLPSFFLFLYSLLSLLKQSKISSLSHAYHFSELHLLLQYAIGGHSNK